MMGAASADLGYPSAQDAFNGCPDGALCIYTVTGWYDGTPEHVNEAYGVHEFHDEFGAHFAVNTQHSGATFSLCKDRAGTDCHTPQAPGRAFQTDLTDKNSIKLSPAWAETRPTGARPRGDGRGRAGPAPPVSENDDRPPQESDR